MPPYRGKKNWYDIIFGILFSIPIGAFLALLLRDAVYDRNLPLGLMAGISLSVILLFLLMLIFQRPGFFMDSRGITPKGKHLIPWEVVDAIQIQVIHGRGRGYYAIITATDWARVDNTALSQREKDRILGKGIPIRLSGAGEAQLLNKYHTLYKILQTV